MHTTEGWLLFLVSFVLLGAASWVIGRGEGFVHRGRHPAAEMEVADA
jgi:hypothetical protein